MSSPTYEQLAELVALQAEEIARLKAHIARQDVRIAEQDARIAELERQLAANARNSSKPPSSDGLGKPAPKSLRTKSGRKPAGQTGRKGETLRQVSDPDEVIRHEPACCKGCGGGLSAAPEAGIAGVRCSRRASPASGSTCRRSASGSPSISWSPVFADAARPPGPRPRPV
ncbi:DUF6444 domain-containing protein [Rhodococcus sp. JS3073]|uniref:DUF6444 domain-containing protein n=1 Tax=Rhodococcus sp. JS3073 TaxID=3002901 RepID=UPI0022859355|nr:DUF6444 domain-containing protein [Rhodococcus sp. JS3073]WAM19388.1 DUF6444 domain-containing protein [Rhodococcus sp. JS3073]